MMSVERAAAIRHIVMLAKSGREADAVRVFKATGLFEEALEADKARGFDSRDAVREQLRKSYGYNKRRWGKDFDEAAWFRSHPIAITYLSRETRKRLRL